MSQAAAVEVTERDVVAVVREHVPRLECDRVRFLTVSDFSTWEVDGGFIVRFTHCAGSDEQLQLEVAALPVLSARLPIAVPELEFAASYGDKRVMGYPKLGGMDGEHFRPTDRAELVSQFAELLAELQGTRPELIDHPVPPWAGPDLDTPLERIAKYAPLIREHAPDLVTAEVASYLEGTVEVPVRPDAPVLSHADLKGEHLLFDERRGRLTAVIDWADMCLSDAAVDLGYLAIWLGPRFMTNVGNAMGASQEMLERALFGMRSYMLIGFGATLAGERHWPLDLVRTQLKWAFADARA